MPPLRTRDSGPRRFRASLISRKDSQGRLNAPPSSCDTSILGGPDLHREGDLHSRTSSASPTSTGDFADDEAAPIGIPDAKKANVFFQDLSDSELHRGFLPKYMKTNICDQCNKRNKSVMQRCTRCNMHFCKSCTKTVDDGKHRFDEAALDWSPPSARRDIKAQKVSIYRRRGKKVMRHLIVSSRNRVEKHRRTRIASSASINTPRRRVLFIDKPVEEIIDERMMSVYEPSDSEGYSFFIRDESAERDGDESEEEGLLNGLDQALCTPAPDLADYDLSNGASTPTPYPSSPASTAAMGLDRPEEQIPANLTPSPGPGPDPLPHESAPIRRSMHDQVVISPRKVADTDNDTVAAARSLIVMRASSI